MCCNKIYIQCNTKYLYNFFHKKIFLLVIYLLLRSRIKMKVSFKRYFMSTKLFLIASSLLTVMSCINMGQASNKNDNENNIILNSENNTNNTQFKINKEKMNAQRRALLEMQLAEEEKQEKEKEKRRKEKVEFHQGQTTKINDNTNKEANRIISGIKDLTNTNTGVITNKIDETREYLGKIDETNKQAHTNIIQGVNENKNLIQNIKGTLENQYKQNTKTLDNIKNNTGNILQNISANKQDVLNKLGSIEKNISDNNEVYYMQFDTLNKNITDVETSIKTELSKHTKALDDIKNGINSEIKQCNESKEKLREEYKSKITILNEQINELTNALNTEHSKHNDDLNKRQEDIQRLNEQYQTLMNEYSSNIQNIHESHKQEIIKLNDQYNLVCTNLQQTMLQYKTKLDQNTKQLNEYMGNNNALHKYTVDTVNKAQEKILKEMYNNASNIVNKIVNIQSDVQTNKNTLHAIVTQFVEINSNIKKLEEQNTQIIQKLNNQYDDQVNKLTNELKIEKQKNSKNQEKIEQITNTYNQNILDLKTKHLTKIAKVRNTCNEQIIELQNKYRNDCLVTQQVLTNNSLALKEQTGELEKLIEQNDKLNIYLRNQFEGVNTKLDNLNNYNINRERNGIIKNISPVFKRKDNEKEKLIKEILAKYNIYCEDLRINDSIITKINTLYEEICNSRKAFHDSLKLKNIKKYDSLNFKNIKKCKFDTKSIKNVIADIKESSMITLNDNLRRLMLLLENHNNILKELSKQKIGIYNNGIKQINILRQDIVKTVNMMLSIDNKEYCVKLLIDKMTKYLLKIEAWNNNLKSFNKVKIQLNGNNDVLKKYWFNACIDYLSSKKTYKDMQTLCHVVKCVLYNDIQGTKQNIQNTVWRHYINDRVYKFFNETDNIRSLFKELKEEFEIQEDDDETSVYGNEDNYQREFMNEENINDTSLKKPIKDDDSTNNMFTISLNNNVSINGKKYSNNKRYSNCNNGKNKLDKINNINNINNKYNKRNISESLSDSFSDDGF